MSRAPKPIDPTVSARHRFGFTLRELRGRAGHSLQGFARRLGRSTSYLSAVELAQVRCTKAFAADCERLLGARGRLLPLWELADRDWTQLTGKRGQHRSPASAGARAVTVAGEPAGSGRAVVTVEELRAIIADATMQAVQACLSGLGHGGAIGLHPNPNGHARTF